MKNTKSHLVRLNEKYTVDLNRVTYVKKHEWNSTWSGKLTKYHEINIFFDVSCGNNFSVDISSSKEEEINRILDLIIEK